ncbi:MAG: ABC transporter permease, partial [Gemmatimonadales bacterium]
MEALLRDLRFGLRMIVKNPLLSSISIVTFALGIGLTTTVYSIVNGALLDGLPFEESNRIVRVLRTDLSRNSQPIGVSVHDYFDWREQQTSFVHMAGLSGRAVNVIDSEGQPVRYDAAEVTPEFFDILGVYPFMGRSFDENDSEVGATSTVILSWDAWQEEFEGNDAVVGRTIQMDGTTGTVIGVMPEDFAFPDRQRIWVPMRLDASVQRDQGRNLAVMARLADGVSLDEAGAQMVTIASRLATEYPETNENLSAEVDTYINIDVGDEIAGFLYTMLAAVLGVLLIACANVANLLLARASTRTREVAVRTALGASRGQVIRQLLTETIVLAFVGSAIGIAIGYARVGWFNRAIAISPPPAWMTFAVDGNVMVFIVIITALAAIGSGLLPAIQATRTDVGEILKDEG